MFSLNNFLEFLLTKVVERDSTAETACCEFPADGAQRALALSASIVVRLTDFML